MKHTILAHCVYHIYFKGSMKLDRERAVGRTKAKGKAHDQFGASKVNHEQTCTLNINEHDENYEWPLKQRMEF